MDIIIIIIVVVCSSSICSSLITNDDIIRYLFYFILLCGPPIYIGRTTRLTRPFVCPSVRLFHRVRNSKTKKRRKIKIGIDVPRDTTKWIANFQLERSKVKVTGRKTSKNWRHLYLRSPAPAQSSRLRTKSSPLLGLLYCRRLRPRATGRTAACRCRHLWFHFIYIFIHQKTIVTITKQANATNIRRIKRHDAHCNS